MFVTYKFNYVLDYWVAQECFTTAAEAEARREELFQLNSDEPVFIVEESLIACVDRAIKAHLGALIDAVTALTKVVEGSGESHA